MKGVCTMVEDIKKILEKLQKMTDEELASYDVKLEDNALQQYVNTHSFLFNRPPKAMDELEPWQRMCYYKVSDETGTDCDVALFTVVVYYLAYDLGEKGWKTNIYDKNRSKYQLENPKVGWTLRGDTMNSYATTIHRYIEHCWIPALDHAREMISDGIISDDRTPISAVHKYKWEDVALRHYGYFRNVLPASGQEYLRLNHTIGNFISVPFVKGGGQFNRPRGTGKSYDFWDLALLVFYKHFHPESDEFSYMKEPLQWLLGNDQNADLCKKWLDSFVAKNGQTRWDAFVEQNFMQDFVNQRDGHFDLPKELWIGHFREDVPARPNVNDFDPFFETYKRIEARGKRIAEKIKKELKDKDLTALANKMVCG